MEWKIKYHPLAEEELSKLDGSVRKIVLKGIIKVSANPKSQNEGGYGKPLGNRGRNDLTGLFKIKYRDIGIRVVYKLFEDEKTHEMYILVVSVRVSGWSGSETLESRFLRQVDGSNWQTFLLR